MTGSIHSKRIPKRDNYRVWQIHDLEVWFVTQIVDFSPENWDATTNLDKAQCRGSLVWIGLGWDSGNLLRLVEIGNVAVMVDTTPEVPRSGPETGTSTDEVQL